MRPRRAGRRRTRPRRAATSARERARRRSGTAAPRAQTCTPSIAMSSGSGAVPGSAAPTACAIRPQFGSPPCSAVLTSGELATARGDGARRSARGRRARRRGRRAARPRRRATMSSASWRSSASSASPKRSSSSLSRRDRDARSRREHMQDHRVVGRQLAVDGDAVEGALDAHAEQQVGGLGARARRRSARSRASSRSAARSCPRPWPGRRAARVPAGSVDLERGALLERVGGHDRRREVGVAVGAQLAARRRAARSTTLATVELDADHAGRGDRDLVLGRRRAPSPPAPCIARGLVEPAAAGRGVRVAGVGDDRAQARRAAQRSRRDAAPARASTPERGEARGARRRPARRRRAARRRAPPLGLDAARPRRRRGSPPGRPRPASSRDVRRAARPSASGRTARCAHASPSVLGQAEHQVEVLDGLRGGALPEVVDRGEDEHLARARSSAWTWMRQRFVSRTSRTPGGRVGELDERLAGVGVARTARAASPRRLARRRHVAGRRARPGRAARRCGDEGDRHAARPARRAPGRSRACGGGAPTP